ncbi:MAG: DUF4347 domain-containing protein, partial [Elainellaceae cyanobacterium]
MKTLLCDRALQRGAQFTYSSNRYSAIEMGDRQSLDPVPPRPTLVVVDPRVDGYESLIAGISPDAAIAVLEPRQDGITQITAILQSRPNVDLHLLCHGDPGRLQLGSSQITQQTIERNQATLRTW